MIIFRQGGAILSKKELARKLLDFSQQLEKEDPKAAEWLTQRAKKLLNDI